MSAAERVFPQDVLDYFAGFLVGLNVFARSPDGRLSHYLYSGFIVDHAGTWLWITAGHSFAELDRALEAGYEIVSAGFYDRIKGEQFAEQPFIPLPDFASMDRAFIDDDVADFGLIAIPPLIRMNLEANGIPAITWDKVGDLAGPYPYYALIGFPEEAVSYSLQGPDTFVMMAPAMLWLERLEDRAAGDGCFKFQFQATAGSVIIDETPLQSVKGMSGGLIIAFRMGLPLRFVAFGIQSSWEPSTWRLFATPLWPVMNLIFEASTQSDD
jgi:hypothetical protein